MTFPRRRPGLGVLVALLVLGGPPAPASAHAVLVASSPPRRATLARPPDRVALTFNERVEPAYSRVSVWDESGRRVDATDAGVDPRDPRVLAVSLPPLRPGRYTVRFRVLSVDGHLVESSFAFTVTGER